MEASERETEEWRPAPDFEDAYEVSSMGRIRGLTRTMRHWKGGVARVPSRLLTPDASTGYARVTMHSGGKMIRCQVHRLVARAFLDGFMPNRHVNHINGNKLDNRVENLEWVTPRENVLHAWRTGLCKPNLGADHGAAKLNDSAVRSIMHLASRGIEQTLLAEAFGVTHAAVSSIVRGKTWKHITEISHA